MKPEPRPSISGYLAIASAVLIWGSWGLLVRWAGVSAVAVSLLSTFFAWCFLTLAWGVRSGPEIRPGPGKNLFLFLFLGIAVALNNVLYFRAFIHTTVANAVLSHYLAPILVFFLAPLLIRERIESRGFVSLLLSLVGLYLIIRGPGLIITDRDLTGILFGTGSAVFFAFQIIAVRYLAPNFSALKLTWYTNLGASLVLFPASYPDILLVPGRILLLIAGMGVFLSGLAPILYVHGLKTVPAHHAAVLSYLEPVGGIFLAFLFLSESPGATTLAGGALILSAGYYLVFTRRKPPGNES